MQRSVGDRVDDAPSLRSRKMKSKSDFESNGAKWSYCGRIILALAAGGVFAVLGWETGPVVEPAGKKTTLKQDSPSAERPGTVKEDGLTPLSVQNAPELRYRSAHALREEGPWGLREEERWNSTYDRTQAQSWTAKDRQADSATGIRAADSPATNHHNRPSVRVTSEEHSRGPPG